MVQGAFSFAVKSDLLDLNPLLGYQKAAGGGRTRLATPEDFQALLRHTDACFRRFLRALRMTGARPGELRSLTWDMVDLERDLLIFPKHTTGTMQRVPRTILRLCQRLTTKPHESSDHVFLNVWGRSYYGDAHVGWSGVTAQALSAAARVRKRLLTLPFCQVALIG